MLPLVLAASLVGPPAPNRQDNLPRVVEMPKREGTDWTRLFLTIGEGVDLIATEDGIFRTRRYGKEGWVPRKDKPGWIVNREPLHEANPLPGMNHSMGRVAWGAAANLMLTEVRKRNSKIGKVAMISVGMAHIFLAYRWYRHVGRLERMAD
jgi:hypothetical protein